MNDSVLPLGENDTCGPGSLMDQQSVRIPLIFAYSTVLLTGLVGNLFTVLVIVVHRSMRTTTNFFLANLAVVDLFVAIFCIAQNMFQIIISKDALWPLGPTLCHIYVFMLHFVPSTSVAILVLVSVEKYIAVMYPLLARNWLTRNLRAAMTLGAWVIGIVANIPYYLSAQYWRFDEHHASCGRTRHLGFVYWTIHLKYVVTASFILWYCVPLLVIAYLYSRIGRVLWNSTRNGVIGRTATLPSPSSTGADSSTQPRSVSFYKDPTLIDRNVVGNGQKNTISSQLFPSRAKQRIRQLFSSHSSSMDTAVTDLTHEEEDGTTSIATVLRSDAGASVASASNAHAMEGRRRVVRLLIAVVLSFATLTLPHHMRQLYLLWFVTKMCNDHWTVLLQPICYLLLFIASCVNPILYAFLSGRFRDAVREIVRCENGRRPKTSSRTGLFRQGTDVTELALLRQRTCSDQRQQSKRVVFRSNTLAGITVNDIGKPLP